MYHDLYFTAFVLKPILSDMNAVIPVHFWFPFALNVFFIISFSVYVYPYWGNVFFVENIWLAVIVFSSIHPVYVLTGKFNHLHSRLFFDNNYLVLPAIFSTRILIFFPYSPLFFCQVFGLFLPLCWRPSFVSGYSTSWILNIQILNNLLISQRS